MRPVTIPIRSLMPQPEEAIEYMPMPREMSTFEMPRLPEPGPGNDVEGARDVLATFLSHVDDWLASGGEPAQRSAGETAQRSRLELAPPLHDCIGASLLREPPALDLVGLAPDILRVLNETLGEGEVAAIVDAGHEIRVQETVFTGTWREQHFDAGGALLHDYLLAAPIPPVVKVLASERSAPTLRALDLPAGTMNVPALIHELQDAMDHCGPDTHARVINLTLLPLSTEDNAHIDRVLDAGSVVILSRGFGNCRISSTAARNVWRVQYFNNMQTLILNTIEVVTIPEVAVAAREDLVETRDRLADLVQWMGDSIAAA